MTTQHLREMITSVTIINVIRLSVLCQTIQNVKLIRLDMPALVHMMQELFLYTEMMQLARRRQKIDTQ